MITQRICYNKGCTYGMCPKWQPIPYTVYDLTRTCRVIWDKYIANPHLSRRRIILGPAPPFRRRTEDKHRRLVREKLGEVLFCQLVLSNS